MVLPPASDFKAEMTVGESLWSASEVVGFLLKGGAWVSWDTWAALHWNSLHRSREGWEARPLLEGSSLSQHPQ